MDPLALATFWLVHLAAVASPGPSFVIVSRVAVTAGVGAGVRVAAGLSLGTLLWATAAWFGLATLFALLPTFYSAVRIAGAALLVFIAVQLWRHAREPMETVPVEAGTPRRAFGLGVVTQLANPKVAVFFGSVFAAVLPPDLDATGVATVFAIVCLNEFGWYAVVALALSRPAMRRGYARIKTALDRATGGLLAALAARMLVVD